MSTTTTSTDATTITEIARIFSTMEYGPAPESDKPAQAWLASHDRQFNLFIDGRWQAPNSKKYFSTNNPATTEKLATIAQADKKDVDRAVTAAQKALPAWVELGCHGRARFLYAIAREIQKNSRLFAVVESLDNGKPIRESRDIDIPLVARHFYHHAGWAQIMETEFADYQEIGVVGQIIPWNFPLLMLAWKIAPALAMGNTVVLKPAEFTSLTALLFAEICAHIGLPAGVVNIVTGYGKTGEAIVQHPDIQKIAFTGSTEVGKIIRRSTAGTGKKLSLELGGKSPFIVFDDADLDSAVEGLVDAIWFNQGQVCCAGSRLLIQENIEDQFIKKVKARLEKFRLGNSLDKAIDMGAIVDPMQLQQIQGLVEEGEKEGAVKWQPSWTLSEKRLKPGNCFFPPTLFTRVSPANSLAQLEIFGPVLVCIPFRTPAEAVEIANNTRYGLAASVWTDNINLALDIAPKIKAGSIWINSTNMFDAAAGFGGYRESGYGREGGREGLWEYVKPKWENQLKSPKNSGDNIKTAKQDSVAISSTVIPVPAIPGIAIPSINRTTKLYIGGKQGRPDGGYSYSVCNPEGKVIGDVSEGNRKDIRNAVEAAHKAVSWEKTTAHNRAQVIYYMAENLSEREDEFAQRIALNTGVNLKTAVDEVALCISRLFTYAAYADKYDGHVHHTPTRNVTLAMPEPIGVIGIIAPQEVSLIGFISTVIPAIAMGNRVIIIPSEQYPLPTTDFYQILETSDLPAGVINIITGQYDQLAEVLANHDDVDGLWYFGNREGSKMVEYASAENMKRTWVNYGKVFDWYDAKSAQGRHFLRHATQIKNIWAPYGE